MPLARVESSAYQPKSLPPTFPMWLGVRLQGKQLSRLLMNISVGMTIEKTSKYTTRDKNGQSDRDL